MQIAVKYDKTSLVKHGISTLIKWYLKFFDDWYENQDKEYDVVFHIYASTKGVKAKSKVMLCAAQTIGNYLFVEGSDNFKNQEVDYTDIVLVRYTEEVYFKLKSDYPLANVFCANFLLFEFDDNYIDVNRNNSILHLGRLCNFKHSIELITEAYRYTSKYPLDCWGNCLIDVIDNTTKYTEKGKMYLPHKAVNTNYKYSLPYSINLKPSYDNKDVYKIASTYKYAISLYKADFLDNVEYAMLEMINAGCFLILHEEFIKSYNEHNCLGDIPYCLVLRNSDFIDDILHTETITVKQYKQLWKQYYDNNKIINNILKQLTGGHSYEYSK